MSLSLSQTWIILGVPLLVVAAGLFVGRSRLRALLGYVVLTALVGLFVTIPGGGPSAVIVGLFGLAALATGRGTHLDDAVPEHHAARGRFTTAGPR
ncbi:MAG: hypothetical protein WD638_07915 [Nitriliruptoraceae bacterium]